MTTVRQRVKQKATAPFALILTSATGMALCIGFLSESPYAWLALVFGTLMFAGVGFLHFRSNCPKCHMPFRGALSGVVFDYGMLGFKYCPNCACALDGPA